MFLLSYCLYGQRQKNVFGKGISHGQNSGQLGALTKTSGPSLCSAECPSLSKISHIYIWSWTLAEDIHLREYPEVIEHLCYRKAAYCQEFLCTEHLVGQWKNLQVLKGRAIARKGSMRRCKKIKVKINTLFYSFDLIFCPDLGGKIWAVLMLVGVLPFQPSQYFPSVNKIL